MQDLVVAHLDCRKHKRNTEAARAFERNLAENLCSLYDDLEGRTYRPGRSICFVITWPKVREVWAAPYRDRVVHHLLYNRVAQRFHNSFVVDSCACIPGRGTMYAAERLEGQIRSITENWKRPAHYLKCDIANFFVSINKHILGDLLAKRIREPFWLWLAEAILYHDPRGDVLVNASASELALVPPHKSLFNQPDHLGLPIGNLSSQFFANVLLDVLDQHAKHTLQARHYIRYVDDFVLLDRSPQWLNYAKADIEEFLPARRGVRLNPRKTIIQSVDRGVDFVGQIVKPFRRTTRKRTRNQALRRIAEMPEESLFESLNSYFGLFRQASHSHHDRTLLANLARSRDFSVNGALTKVYRRGTNG